MGSDLAVVADGLHKHYGETRALNGFDLAVPEGSICGLLGPNGAGKTTAVRSLATLLRFDRGRAVVAGYDVVGQAPEVRYRIGLTGQEAAVDQILTGRDNLVMFGRLYHMSKARARRRADELLERFDLTDAAEKPVRQYSGGMRRRLDLAVSLIMAPPVLFLDEPTTGLDIRHRREVWSGVRSLVDGGTTVLLTTHYLEEADQLADQISVIDRGRVIATGTPAELKAMLGGEQIEVVLPDAEALDVARRLVAEVAGSEPEVDSDSLRISAPVQNRIDALTGVVRSLDDAGVAADDIALRRPTLDDVFLRLTGHTAEAGAAGEAGAGDTADETTGRSAIQQQEVAA